MATRSAGSPRILLLLGGTWHDFDGFGRVFRGWFPDVEITRDLDAFGRLDAFHVVAMFTCLTRENEDGSPASEIFSDGIAEPLARWVASGGGLLALHGATVSGITSPMFGELAGGVFVEHPAASTTNGSVEYVFPFSVHRTQSRHPITEGVESFGVLDEFYIERHGPDIEVHMTAIDRGAAHPVVWTRAHGNGRVARITLGHDARVWNLPAYRRLVIQAAGWLAA